MQNYTIYTKTLNVKGSRADTTAAQVAAVMKTVDTDVRAATRNEVSVFLNCDTGGTANLDVDIQVSPDATSPVWYKTDAFTQVTTGASQQVKVPAAIAVKIRALPVLTGAHNFGLQVSLPLRGYST